MGQMIFSPVFGWWANKMPSIRIPFIVSLAIFCAASALYSSLDLIENNVKYWMLIARFFVGVSSANVVICRSYLSAATTLEERTKAVSILTLAQTLGNLSTFTDLDLDYSTDCLCFRIYFRTVTARCIHPSWQQRICASQNLPHKYVHSARLDQRYPWYCQLLSLSSVHVSRPASCSS